MSSPYSSALLQDPPPTSRPSQLGGSRTPLRGGYAPAPQLPVQYVPQPAYVTTAPAGGSRSTGVLGMLLVLVLAVAVGFGGWALARYNSPTVAELNGYQAIAAHEGQFTGQLQGIADGKQFAESALADTTALKGDIAQAKSYNSGYGAGKSIGERNPYGSGYGGYGRGYGGGGGCGYSCYGGYGSYGGYYGSSYGGSYGGSVGGAVADAQALANETGQEVDVDVN